MKKKAYSLLELSVVIVIISILISGALTSVTNITNSNKEKITRERFTEIYRSMGRYLRVNGRLPCPAVITNKKSIDAAYGAESATPGTCTGTYASTSSTNLVYGMVPVRALALGNEYAEDGFEGKIGYIVDKRFTKATVVPDAGVDSFGTSPSTSIITINSKQAGATQQNTADAIFALISYGANKAGAFEANMATQNTRSGDASELDNDINGSNNFDNVLVFEDTTSDVFDDMVLFKTRNVLVSDYGAYFAIPCPSTSLSKNYGGAANYSWSQTNYNQIAASTTACPSSPDYRFRVLYQTRRCGAFGIWDSDVVAPCSNS